MFRIASLYYVFFVVYFQCQFYHLKQKYNCKNSFHSPSIIKKIWTNQIKLVGTQLSPRLHTMISHLWVIMTLYCLLSSTICCKLCSYYSCNDGRGGGIWLENQQRCRSMLDLLRPCCAYMQNGVIQRKVCEPLERTATVRSTKGVTLLS